MFIIVAMEIVQPDSLANTVDAVNAALFMGRKIALKDRQRAARFIAERQGQPGCYQGLFAPLPTEPRKRLTLFTGEVTTCASALHIGGQEAYRALLQLEVVTREVQAALNRVNEEFAPLLGNDRRPGMF